MIPVLATVVIGYLIGSLPWGLWLGLAFRGVDVRTIGSRNLGATNVFRSLGRALGIATLILDMAKGALPVWIVPATPLADHFPGGPQMCAIVVGLAAVAGHVWTLFAGFKGGKGVATMAGVLLALAPPAFLVFASVFVATVAFTRYISLGSILGSLAFTITIAVAKTWGPTSPTFVFALVVTALVILRHRENIDRLVHGEERKFTWSQVRE
jgi:glycerol-3-phosphate acyltransferase PlsY